MNANQDKKWNEAYARLVLEEIAREGISISAMAKKLGVTPQRIFWWKKVLKDRDAVVESTEEVAFVELPGVKPSLPGAVSFTVQARNGRKVEVPVGFDARELCRLLAVVEDLPC